MQDRLRNQSIWPRIAFRSLPVHRNQTYKKELINEQRLKMDSITLLPKIVDYLAMVCDSMQFGVGTFQLTLSVLSRYLGYHHVQEASKQKEAIGIRISQPLQLLMLVSLLIASKLTELSPLNANDIHHHSSHCFTNKDIFRTEVKILERLGYHVLESGVPDRKIKVMFLNLGYVMGSREHEEVSKLSENVQRIVWYYLYTQDLKLNDSDFAALPAVIIHMTLIVATQCSGNFLQTIWAAKMVDVSIENVYFLTEKLFKLILGKEKYEEYSF